MDLDLKEIKTGNTIKPNSFRTTFNEDCVKLEFGEFIENEDTINVLSEVEFNEKDFAAFFKGILYSMAEHDVKSDKKIFDMIIKQIDAETSK